MEVKTKQAILKYFKNCIEEDSKEYLKIDLNNNKSIIYLPGKDDEDFDKYLNFSYDEIEKNNFYKILGINQEEFNIDFLIGFFLKEKIDFDNKNNNSIKNGGKYELNKYINYDNNSLRKELVNKLKVSKLDLPYLTKENLEELFFSPDKGKNGISKIEFKPNLNFLNFYDNNKNDNFYLVLEYIETEDIVKNKDNKSNTITPIYLIGIEISPNDNGSFNISLKESEPEFLYNIKNKKGFNVFPFSSENNGDDGFQKIQNLENDIKGITSSFKEKINYYKSKVSKDIIQNEEFIFNPCIITGTNNIQIIKNLIFDYNGIINNKEALENLKDSSLGFIFNEIKFIKYGEKNNIINISPLNQEQENIVNDSLNQNISVVIGPPGTGKSQVVINLLANIYINNKTAIFASKNNTAVDTVIKKLEDYNFPYFPFLRLGNKESTDKWLPKILKKLSQNTGIHKKYDFFDIESQKKIIKNIYNEIENIQDDFLNYYQEYEKFELLLGEISDEKLKDFLYKILPLNIDFQKLNENYKENEELLNVILKLEKDYTKTKENFDKLKIQIFELGEKDIEENLFSIIKKDIKTYKNDYILKINYYNKIIQRKDEEIKASEKDINNKQINIDKQKNKLLNFIFSDNFLYLITNGGINYNSLKQEFNTITNGINKANKSIKENDIHEFFIENGIDNFLVKILERGNFIDYNNNLNKELEKIKRDFLEINEYGFFKRLFGIKRRDFKKIYNLFLDLINLQPNTEIKNYFITISQLNSSDSNDIIDKIKKISILYDYKNIYTKYTQGKDELKKYNLLQKKYLNNIYNIFGDHFKNIQFSSIGNDIKNIEIISIIYNEIFELNNNIIKIKKEKVDTINNHNSFISNISNNLQISFNDFDYEHNINILNLLLKAQENYKIFEELNTEKQKKLANYKIFKDNIFYKLEISIGIELLNYLKEKFNKNIGEILKKIIKLEEINITSKNIDILFDKFNLNKKSIFILSKELYGEQKVLEEKSKNLFSSIIYQNIVKYIPLIKDSIEGIYNAYDKSKYLGKNKDLFLKEMYKNIFSKINIFVTTNQSTYNLPLEKGFYDYLIIDEASQNDLASIIPLMYRCKRIIIIGDPNQLKNITKLKEKNSRNIFNQKLNEINIAPKVYEVEFKNIFNYGESKGYSLSAFNSINHIYNGIFNQKNFILKEHYRCYSDIINFSNKIIPEYNLFPKSYINNKFINNKITPLGIHWIENIKTKSIEKTNQNEEEANSIILYLKKLIQLYGDKVSIGVITPYRNQVNLLNGYIRKNGLSEQKNILINTVHKFQGDEKDIILYSPVYPKSNLWNDKNLLNVAISRAKNAFYIFGDKDSIYKAKDENGINLMKELIDYIDNIEIQKETIDINKFDTKYEKLFFEELKKAKIKFDFHNLENNGKYELDFKLKLKGFNQYLNIELDGATHENKKSYDYTRNKIVEKLGNIEVIRYSNKYLIENISEIINSLKKICEIEEVFELDSITKNISNNNFNYKEFVNNKYGKNVIQYQNEKIEIIQKAKTLNKNIRFTYKNQKGEISKREIKIIDFGEYEFEGLKYFGVKGNCKFKNNEKRIFNIKNMKYIEIL